MFDLESLVTTVGLIGVAAMVFAESGLLIGFFLPGDSLLFTAGFLAAQGFFDPWILVITLVIASIAGTQVGYVFGRRWGRKLFHRPSSRLFHQENLRRAEDFYHRHGGKTIIIARFIPIVRTFAPIVAGIAQMSLQQFLTYNIVGGLIWAGGVTLLGIWLGDLVPNIDRFLLPVLAIIIFLSILPGLVHMLRTPERRQSVWSKVRSVFHRS